MKYFTIKLVDKSTTLSADTAKLKLVQNINKQKLFEIFVKFGFPTNSNCKISQKSNNMSHYNQSLSINDGVGHGKHKINVWRKGKTL